MFIRLTHSVNGIMSDATVTLGITGVGHRGTSLLRNCAAMEDVRIRAVCDLQERRLDAAQHTLEEFQQPAPDRYTDHSQMVSEADLDGVIIATSWRQHIPFAIEAMEAGLWAAMDVGPASSLEECWELVQTSQETSQQCMLLENCCFRREPLSVLNMARDGVLGDLVHTECGYCHDLRPRLNATIGTSREETSIPMKNDRYYRSIHHEKRNGDLYPTHGVGPMAKCLDINQGNRFVSLSSHASKAAGLRDWGDRHLPDDHPNRDIDWSHGDIITTVLTCANGQTCTITHDVSLPRPDNSKRYCVRGTRGMWQDERDSIYIDDRGPDHEWEPAETYIDEYEHELWREYRNAGIEAGHGGSDYLVLRSFVRSIAQDVRPPIDVYDAATWMAIAPLSEDAIATGDTVAFPDFTDGNWLTDEPIFGLTGEVAEDRLSFSTLL